MEKIKATEPEAFKILTGKHNKEHQRSNEAKQKRGKRYKQRKKAFKLACKEEQERDVRQKLEENKALKLKLRECNSRLSLKYKSQSYRKRSQMIHVDKHVTSVQKGYPKGYSKGYSSHVAVDENAYLASQLGLCLKLVDGAITFPYSGPILGKGSFGVVKVGCFSQLSINVAVKIPKVAAFDATSEARILSALNGSKYFPFVFGVCENALVLELVACCVDGIYVTSTIFSELSNLESCLSCNDWLRISYLLAKAVSFLHQKCILHNDLKEDNVLLKNVDGVSVPVLTDFGKATHSAHPKVYNLNYEEKLRYNKNHRFLAHELRNVSGTCQSFSTDCYSLGRIYKSVGYLRFIVELQVLGHRMKNVNVAKRLTIEEALDYLIPDNAGVNEDILADFSREDLNDLFCGVEHFLLRRRIWKIIEKIKEANSGFASGDSLVHFEPIADQSPPFLKAMPRYESSSPIPMSSSSNANLRSSAGETCEKDEASSTLKMPSPVFILYKDNEIIDAAARQAISPDLVNRLVRNTISNMRSSCQSLESPREPTKNEIEEMAKALCKKYTCLQSRDETEQSHLSLYKKLKKRLQNAVPPKKPQGKTPSRRPSKRSKVDLPTPNLPTQKPCEEDQEPDHENAVMYEPELALRHYNFLDAEQKKAKPNKVVVNQYLNLEFQARRRLFQETRREGRSALIFEAYPCFKDPVEVIEEVRRSLLLKEEDTLYIFTEKCLTNLRRKLDPLIYYGIHKNCLKPPRNPTDDNCKVIHLMKGINDLFKSKTSKHKKQDIFHIVEDGEDPDEWRIKRHGYAPGLIATRNGAVIVLGKEIFIIFKEDELVKAVVAFMASFYLLDLDYPANWLLSLSVLQRLVFNDIKIHPDVKVDVVKALEDFAEYCS